MVVELGELLAHLQEPLLEAVVLHEGDRRLAVAGEVRDLFGELTSCRSRSAVAPSAAMPRSMKWKAGTFRIIRTTRSPGPTPSPWR